MPGLEDKVVIVTGGSNGIGAAIVELFLNKGAKVASIDVREHASPVTDSFLPLKCNVASEAEVNDSVKQVVEKWGTVHILVNSAGVMDASKPVGETSRDVWERCLNVNLNGPFHLIRACLPSMHANEGPVKGSIVNVCSTAAVRGGAAGAAYTASKHALLGLSRNTAWMYRHEGIRCNVVLPGGVRTNIMQNSGESFDPSRIGVYLGCSPGVAEPGDIANAILYLATSDNVNGAELAVDQGWTTV
ncbi:hypothetical protein VTO42DRAFT_1374 [Malbranchea cinnamomea]